MSGENSFLWLVNWGGWTQYRPPAITVVAIPIILAATLAIVSGNCSVRLFTASFQERLSTPHL